MDKCPKCGEEECESPNHMRRYSCGSYDGIQSELCRARCELAELKERHGKLVEAAKYLVSRDSDGLSCEVFGCEYAKTFEQHSKDCPLEKLSDALESEVSNG